MGEDARCPECGEPLELTLRTTITGLAVASTWWCTGCLATITVTPRTR